MTDEVRIASNESLFREVNDRIEELAIFHDFGASSRLGLVCECPNLDCTASIELTVAEYEDVRFHADRFAIAPEHDVPQFEVIVARNGRYWTAEKTAKAAEVATTIYEPAERDE